MGKGGKTNRVEPTDTSWTSSFLDYAVMFQKDGWLDFFERIKGFDSEVSYRFAQGLEKDTVTFDTLKFELKK